jgi:hypothetical protein
MDCSRCLRQDLCDVNATSDVKQKAYDTALVTCDLLNVLINRIGGDEFVDRDLMNAGDTVNPVLKLNLVVWVPRLIDNDELIAERIESD